jgi:hypothetical protein
LWLDGVLYDDNSFLVKFLDKFDKEEWGYLIFIHLFGYHDFGGSQEESG